MQRRDNSEALATETLPELPIEDGVTRWNADKLDELQRKARSGKYPEEVPFQQALFKTIDVLGARSKIAQGINAPLTSVNKLRENREYRLYLMTRNHRGLGILKIGTKKLFVTHPRTKSLVEIHPPCVLDFYVSEQVQRRGLGKFLYGAMLGLEGIQRPEKLAIDRPSPKFINFMKRHFNLEHYTPEVNNFVVFHEFFEGTVATVRGQLKRVETPNQPRTAGSGGGTPNRATPQPQPQRGRGSPGVGATRVGRGTPPAGVRSGQSQGRNFLAGRASQLGSGNAEGNEDMDRYLKGNPGGSLEADDFAARRPAYSEDEDERTLAEAARVGASGGAQKKSNNTDKEREEGSEVFFDNPYERMAADLLKGRPRKEEIGTKADADADADAAKLDSGRHAPGISVLELPQPQSPPPPPPPLVTSESDPVPSLSQVSPPRLRPQVPVDDDYPGSGLNAPASTRFLLPPPPVPLEERDAMYNGYYSPARAAATISDTDSCGGGISPNRHTNVLLGGGGEPERPRAKGGAPAQDPLRRARAPLPVVHSKSTGNNHSAGAAAALSFEEDYSSEIPAGRTAPSTDTLNARLEALNEFKNVGLGHHEKSSESRGREDESLEASPSAIDDNAYITKKGLQNSSTYRLPPAKRKPPEWGSSGRPNMANAVGGHVPLLHTPPATPAAAAHVAPQALTIPTLRVPPPPPPASAPAAEKAAYDRYLDELEEQLENELSASRERSKALEASLHVDTIGSGRRFRIDEPMPSALKGAHDGLSLNGSRQHKNNASGTNQNPNNSNNNRNQNNHNNTTPSFLDYSGHGAGVFAPPLRYTDLVRGREQADQAQLLKYRDPDYLHAARTMLDPAAPKLHTSSTFLKNPTPPSNLRGTGPGRTAAGTALNAFPARRSKMSKSERRALWDPNLPANQPPAIVPFAYRHGLQRHRQGEGPREFLPPLFAPVSDAAVPGLKRLAEPYPLPVLLSAPSATAGLLHASSPGALGQGMCGGSPQQPHFHRHSPGYAVGAPIGSTYPTSSPNISSVAYNILS